MLYSSVEQLVGKTPIVELTRLEKELGLEAKIFAKLEMVNPAGSAKDRIAYQMILDAEDGGRLKPGDTIIEPTSGNTGIGLAAIGAARGYSVVIVMPDSMSEERRKLMLAYGAELVLTPGAEGMAGAIRKAEALHTERGGIIAGQFDNPSNWKAHYRTTGPEIHEDLNGRVDMFIAGIGTGGTITGTGKYLKEKAAESGRAVEIIGMEPDTSPLLTRGTAGPHKLQGIGANFVPEVLDRDVVDEIVTESIDNAMTMLKMLGEKEGLFVGISSGAALAAAVAKAEMPENKGKNIVVLLPDGGNRYLSNL